MLAITPFRNLSPTLRVLLLSNLFFFLVSMFASMFRQPALASALQNMMLIPARYAEAWRLLTYAFVHVAPMHFLFNMLMLWMFGDEVSQILGVKRFAAFYLVMALFSGLFSVPFYLADGISAQVHILGASGAIFGVMYAYMVYFPNRVILLFFVIPMKIKFAVPLFALLDLLMINSGDGVAHLVHLGGFVGGILWFLILEGGKHPLQASADMGMGNYGYGSGSGMGGSPGGGSGGFFGRGFFAKSQNVQKLRREDEVFAKKENLKDDTFYEHDFRLDEILKKISEQGMNSLSSSDREYLNQVSRKQQLRQGNNRIIRLDDYKENE